jgi:hypothetical protein
MHEWMLIYLRFVAVSVAALSLAACVKLAPPGLFAAQPPEPRIGESPAALDASERAPTTDADRIAALEAEVAALDAQLSHLRQALDVLGPLPAHPDLFIPVADVEPNTESSIANLYAPPPMLSGASSLFYEAELGSFATRQAAEARWKQLVATNRLGSLKPAYHDAAGSSVRLAAGPLTTEADVDALCVELSALGSVCRVAAPIRAY